MAQNVEGYNQHPPVVIPIQQNIPRQQVRQNFNNQNPRRKEGFAQRMIIGLVCYVATIIVATILIMNAVHEETSVQGLAVVCSSLLGYAGLIFYIDQPEFNGNI